MSEEENIRLVREIGEVKAELSGLKAEVAGTNQRLDDIVITQLKDHGKRLAMQDIRISSLEQAENRRAGGDFRARGDRHGRRKRRGAAHEGLRLISGVPHPAPPHPRLEGPCKRLRPRRSSGTLPSGGTLSHPWGVLTINMDSYGMDTPFPVRGAFP